MLKNDINKRIAQVGWYLSEEPVKTFMLSSREIGKSFPEVLS